MYWLSWPACQVKFRILAHSDFGLTEPVRHWLTQAYSRIGDTKVVEDSNKVARRAEAQAGDHHIIKTANVFHQIRFEGSALQQSNLQDACQRKLNCFRKFSENTLASGADLHMRIELEQARGFWGMCPDSAPRQSFPKRSPRGGFAFFGVGLKG